MIEGFAEKKIGEDPFLLLTVNPLSKKLMEDEGIVSDHPDASLFPSRGTLEFLPGYPRHYTLGKAKAAKAIRLFCWGFGGGFSLIAPMLLMRLHRTLLTQLLTTGVSVIIFAAIVAAAAGGVIPGLEPVDLGPQDVLTATAAYAAVLVVFVSQS